jgi:hypothetical protein
MKLGELAPATGRAVVRAYDAVRDSKAGEAVARGFDWAKRFARLEYVLAPTCALSPFVMWFVDSQTFRESISAYYDMDHGVAFYVPLTVAAMLFLVNGVIKENHAYNAVLGVLLFGVIIFDHQNFTVLHAGFAIGFFTGNVLVMVRSSGSWRLKGPILGFGAALATLGWLLDDRNVFWPETVSLAIIATHYLLHSWRGVRYRAPGPAH